MAKARLSNENIGVRQTLLLFFSGELWLPCYGRKPKIHFTEALYHVMSGHWQSIFKELAKELHQDPAVLRRDLGKLAEEFSEQTVSRGVVEMLYHSWRKPRQPKRSIRFANLKTALRTLFSTLS
jgi:hypothetical protein